MQIDSQEIKIRTHVNGDEYSIQKITYDSGVAGPHIYLQANVHGAELQGNLVIRELMNYFKNNKFVGKISFVPFANPMGSNQSFGGYTYGRFNPRTGDNWNRNYVNFIKFADSDLKESLKAFVARVKNEIDESITNEFKKFIEQNLSHYLKSAAAYGVNENKFLFTQLQLLASDADVVLDLHTGSRATRYLYAAEYESEWAKKMNFPHTLLIPNEFDGAMDEACFFPWVQLAKELKAAGREFQIPFQSFTVELGSEERVSSEEATLDASRILQFLKDRGFHNNEVAKTFEPQYACKLKNYRSYFAAKAGLYEFFVAPGEHFKKSDVLATVNFYNRKTHEWQKTDVLAQKDGIMINCSATANLGEGQFLLQVMEECFDFQ